MVTTPHSICRDDTRNFEPTVARRSLGEGRQTRLKFEGLDKSIRELRAMFKQHP